MSLHFTRSGTPDAPAIVFLHGMGMGQWMWYEQIQALQDYDCFNVDLPGHGDSAATEWESFQQAADLVGNLIAEQLAGKQVHLIGMSMGAVVATYVLIRHSDKIMRAVLTGAMADTPPAWLTRIQGNVIAAILPTGFGKQLFARMLNLPSDEQAMTAYNDSISKLSIQSFRRATLELADFTLPVATAQITTPTLFVTGEKDAAVMIRGVKILSETVPDATGFYAPGTHHGWNGEDPELFNAMARAWLEAQPLPDRLIPV